MADKLIHYWKQWDDTQRVFSIYGLIVLFGIFSGILTGWYFLAGIPALLLVGYLTLVDFRKIFFLLLFFIPLSTEVYLPNGFGTDLPTEPLMVGLMMVYFLLVLQYGKTLKADFFRHPLTLLLLLHLFWIYATTLTSSLFFVSFKFSLAKTWYIVVFYFLAGHLLRTAEDFKKVFWVIFIPLMFTVVVTIIRHKAYDFSFSDVHRVLHPFQRNHVNYAASIALFFPILCLATGWYRRWSWPWMLLAGAIPVLLVATYLSYTRAAYVAILIALGAYYLIRLRLIRHTLALALVAGLAGVIFFINDNHYLEYAPNYDRTISHKEFDNLLTATYKGEDISTMERIYRWVAGSQMTQENPLLGFGPGNFVNFYESYTVTSFQTYVSDNEERSGIHSYFLMTLVEQGIIGLVIFLILSFYVLIRGEDIYHRSSNPDRRRVIMMVLLCTIVIDAFLIINDLIETDKVGSYFFLCIAVLVNMELAESRERSN